MTDIFEYCSGQNCPLKDACLRYKEKINRKTMFHLAYPPYDATKNRCGYFVGKDGNNLLNQEILNANGNGKGD